jgi:putative (di)nucleoside polyphosphate hydrolase
MSTDGTNDFAGAPADAFPEHRPNVGLVLFNSAGLVWVGRRYATTGPHNWQFPQGGVDPGEDVESAALRELYEETGITTDLVEKLGDIPGWVAYDFPREVLGQRKKNRWKGQKQRWFAYRFIGADSCFDLKAVPPQEFDAFKWVPLEDTPELIIPWKRPVYETVAQGFRAFSA